MLTKIKNLTIRYYILSKYKVIKKYIKAQDPQILDIGAGNHSAKKIKIVFPSCKYYGVDISKDYNNDDEDFALMEEFYELDLTQLDYSKLKDDSFDLIIMSHIIEHLHNGDKVIDNLIPKLKSGGIKRNFIRILIMPLVIPLRLLFSRKLMATDFWDLLGFAEYVVSRRN